MEEDYKNEKQCEYKGETYSVRDNGAVMRHSREGKRLRKDDNVWTFGKKDNTNGYMCIGLHRVHIIVATAFIGNNDTKRNIVDHIDTNRCNNRAENLRWVTRIENALLNPDTLKRITFLCGGDITKFLKNPACIRELSKGSKDLDWMRTVTSQEAENAYNNVMNWGLRPIQKEQHPRKNKAEWIFHKYNYPIHNVVKNNEFCRAKSPDTALQMNWKTPTEYPCCPIHFQNNGLKEYFDNLRIGNVFSTNQYATYRILDKMWIDNDSAILVITQDYSKDAVKPFGLAKIYCSGGQFIHQGISTFWEENGARQRFTEMQGLKWEGEDSIDNYC